MTTSSHSLGSRLPEFPRTFAHPRLFHWLGVSAAAFCAGTLLLVVALALFRSEGSHWLLLGACLAVLGASLYLSATMVRRSRDTVEISDEGLWYHSPGAPSLLLRWEEIAEVQPQNVMQRLLVMDVTGTRRIYLEYHLEDFGELRRIVLERAGRAA